MQLLGVYDEYLVTPLAQVLISLGVKRSMVVYGQDKLDELSMSALTTVCEIKDGWFKTYTVTPERFGLPRCKKEELVGGTPAENAAITRAILGDETGPKRDAVLLNAGAALYIAGKADTFSDGVALAADLIDSGKVLAALEKVVEVSDRPEYEAAGADAISVLTEPKWFLGSDNYLREIAQTAPFPACARTSPWTNT